MVRLSFAWRMSTSRQSSRAFDAGQSPTDVRRNRTLRFRMSGWPRTAVTSKYGGLALNWANSGGISRVSAKVVLEKVQAYGRRSAHYLPSMDASVEAITKAAARGDLIITLGAGNVSSAAERILSRLRAEAAA